MTKCTGKEKKWDMDVALILTIKIYRFTILFTNKPPDDFKLSKRVAKTKGVVKTLLKYLDVPGSLSHSVTKYFAISSWPITQALCSGVRPSNPVDELQSDFVAYLTTARFPVTQALCNCETHMSLTSMQGKSM